MTVFHHKQAQNELIKMTVQDEIPAHVAGFFYSEVEGAWVVYRTTPQLEFWIEPNEEAASRRIHE